MEYMFDNALYRSARESRLGNLFRHLDVAALNQKRLLEVGCGTGEIGQAFVEAGASVVSIDARAEYIAEIEQRFPGRPAYVVDLEQWDPAAVGQFDAIVCFGLLYHLAEPLRFLTACSVVAGEIYLETVVSDSIEPVCPVVLEEGPDQAWSGRGCRPSPAWLNQTLVDLGFDVEDISSGTANWGGQVPSIFDWTPCNDGQWQRDGALLRKMLICTRKQVGR